FIIMSLWGVGGTMVIFLAGLQGVPAELYEAASIDGAGALHRFRQITLPMLTPVIFFNLLIGLIDSFQIFSSVFIMTNGGPQNQTLFYVLYLYWNGFKYFQMGYASALAWVLFVIIMLFTLLQFRMSKRWVYYETDIGV
ncbi:MAG: sugar ABC transporter permease, partial [Caldilineaceae bacterium]|nr:sugar ABC transporter permease [Caldilineaceae bacterium]